MSTLGPGYDRWKHMEIERGIHTLHICFINLINVFKVNWTELNVHVLNWMCVSWTELSERHQGWQDLYSPYTDIVQQRVFFSGVFVDFSSASCSVLVDFCIVIFIKVLVVVQNLSCRKNSWHCFYISVQCIFWADVNILDTLTCVLSFPLQRHIDVQ